MILLSSHISPLHTWGSAHCIRHVCVWLSAHHPLSFVGSQKNVHTAFYCLIITPPPLNFKIHA
eukprot:UN15579